MGGSSSKSKNDTFSLKTSFKIDTTIQAILQTKHFRFGFLMKATQVEVDRIQERWQDFLAKTSDEFVYHTGTKYSQIIKISRELPSNKLSFIQTSSIDIDNDDLNSLTKMFNEISDTIRDSHKTEVVGLEGRESKNSSLNLLATDKVTK